jgi:hypothetical protein
MDYPLPLPKRVDSEVSFSAPKAVVEATSRKGRVLDAVSVGPVKDEEWGWYLYFSELIEWEGERSKSVRLSYYYAPFGSTRWLWGGQYSIEESASVIKELLEKTLQKKSWFA